MIGFGVVQPGKGERGVAGGEQTFLMALINIGHADTQTVAVNVLSFGMPHCYCPFFIHMGKEVWAILKLTLCGVHCYWCFVASKIFASTDLSGR